jgi:hypothetical protein
MLLLKTRWIGNHPSVTFHFNPEVGRLLVAPSNPHSSNPSTPRNCYYQARLLSIPAQHQIAFLRLLDGGGDELKSGTSATYPWSSMLFTVFALFSTE